LCCITKIFKNESNSQQYCGAFQSTPCCVVSQRYSKMKAIHNILFVLVWCWSVVLYHKDIQKWKQFTTIKVGHHSEKRLCCITKIFKNESNSQRHIVSGFTKWSCVVSQRYSKMKAIHNPSTVVYLFNFVVLYHKDIQKWKQFTTNGDSPSYQLPLCCITKIFKNESNSQPTNLLNKFRNSCVVSQRYSKMKAIHNRSFNVPNQRVVVLYHKDIQKWKQFTTKEIKPIRTLRLCCITKIFKNESNSQRIVKFINR